MNLCALGTDHPSQSAASPLKQPVQARMSSLSVLPPTGTGGEPLLAEEAPGPGHQRPKPKAQDASGAVNFLRFVGIPSGSPVLEPLPRCLPDVAEATRGTNLSGGRPRTVTVAMISVRLRVYLYIELSVHTSVHAYIRTYIQTYIHRKSRYTTLHYTTLLCIALHDIALHYVARHDIHTYWYRAMPCLHTRKDVGTCIHCYTYMHAYPRTYIRTYVHTYIYIYMYTRTYTPNTYTYTYTYTYAYAHAYAYAYAYAYIYINTCMQASIHPSIRPSVRPSIHPSIHPSMICMYMYVCMCMCVYIYIYIHMG